MVVLRVVYKEKTSIGMLHKTDYPLFSLTQQAQREEAKASQAQPHLLCKRTKEKRRGWFRALRSATGDPPLEAASFWKSLTKTFIRALSRGLHHRGISLKFLQNHPEHWVRAPPAAFPPKSFPFGKTDVILWESIPAFSN